MANKFLVIVSSVLSLPFLISAVNGANQCDTPFCNLVADEIANSINKSIDPCTDFFEYSCGGWKSSRRIPDEHSRHSQFDVLEKQMQYEINKAIKSDNQSKSNSVTYARKLYNTCIALDSKPELGKKEMKDFLKKYTDYVIGNGNDANQDQSPWYQVYVRSVLFSGVKGFFTFSVQSDAKQVTRNVLMLDSINFPLGDKELQNLQENESVAEAYEHYLDNVAKLLGLTTEKTIADSYDIIQLESDLAQFKMPTEQMRNPETIYNKFTLKKFSEKTNFDWLGKILDPIIIGFNANYKLTNLTEIVVSDVEYFVEAIQILDQLDSETYNLYFAMQAVMTFGELASKEIRKIAFEFNRVMSGVKKQKELWQNCLDMTYNHIPLSLSRLFVNNAFSDKEKDEASILIKNVHESYKNLVKENKWLDTETRAKSLEKLEKVHSNVAYPDWLLDDAKLDKYYGLDIDEQFSLLSTEPNLIISLCQFRVGRIKLHLLELTIKIDSDLKWPMPPAIINAAYEATQNSITIPAGILKVPFFDSRRPASLNYGGIGVVIGHELTHGLDDEGRQFDAQGNLKKWWTNESIAQFSKYSDCFVKQYGSQRVEEVGLNVNGQMTLGENIADNGGIHESYLAFEKAESESPSQRLAKLSEYSPEQLFFIAHAQVWCGLIRPEALRNRVQYDPHSPMKFRVNVPLSNSAKFSGAFQCPAGSPMNPADKCQVW